MGKIIYFFRRTDSCFIKMKVNRFKFNISYCDKKLRKILDLYPYRGNECNSLVKIKLIS